MPENELTPTQLALNALECCEENAKDTHRLAESVHAQAVEGAAFQGKVVEHMENQDEVNRNLAEVMTNHLPHILGQIGELRGQNKIIMWVLGAVVGLVMISGLINVLFI